MGVDDNFEAPILEASIIYVLRYMKKKTGNIHFNKMMMSGTSSPGRSHRVFAILPWVLMSI